MPKQTKTEQIESIHSKTMKKTKNKPIHMLLYGNPGAGKTILASTFPKALYFDFDSGTQHYEDAFKENKYIRGDKLIDYLAKAIEQVREGTFEYETIVIDSLTNLENNAIARFKGLNSSNWATNLYSSNQKKLFQDDWGNISGSTISMLSNIRDLPVNIVIITQIDTVKDNGTIKYAPSLVGKGQYESLHFADVVGYLFTKAGETKEERYLAVSATLDDNFYAKARILSGNAEPIKNPSYEKLVKLLQTEEVKLDFSE